MMTRGAASLARGVIARMAVIPTVILGAALGGCDSDIVAAQPTTLLVALETSIESYPGLTVEIRDVAGTQSLGIDDFSAIDVPGRRFQTGVIEISAHGEVTVAVTLEADGSVLAEGELAFQSAPETHWEIELAITRGDPTFECGRCVAAQAIPIPPELQEDSGDDLWIVLLRAAST